MGPNASNKISNKSSLEMDVDYRGKLDRCYRFHSHFFSFFFFVTTKSLLAAVIVDLLRLG